MLDSAIKDQLKGLFAQLEAHYTFDIFCPPSARKSCRVGGLVGRSGFLFG